MISSSREFAVCLGMDAFRLAIGRKPKNFTPMQIAGLIREVAEERQPLALHPAVSRAHAQFGGDLREMQRNWDMHCHQRPKETPND